MNRLFKKLIMILILIPNFIFISFAVDIQIDEDIDPISLDLLFRNGLISIEEKKAILKGYKEDLSSSILDSREKNSNEDNKSTGQIGDYDSFYIESIDRIGESAIKIIFSQDLDDKSLNKAYYKIYMDDKIIFNYSDFEIRRVSNDSKSIVIRLKDEAFKSETDYEIRISTSLKSKYDVKLEGLSYYVYDFTTPSEDFKNKEVISYEVYDEGFIDVDFKYEVTNEFLKNRLDYKFTYDYNGIDRIRTIKNIELLEDQYGVANIVRLYSGDFNEKYDYTLDLSKFNIDNSIFKFPGGIALSRSFGVYDVDIIDNYTLDVSFSEPIDNIGSVRIKGRAVVKDFNVLDDRLIINLDKEAGLDFLRSYKLEIIDAKTKDGREFFNVSYDFSSEDSKAYKDHISLLAQEARWLGDSYIEISFNKPVKLDNNVNAYIKIRDKNNKRIPIDSVYMNNPYTWIIKTKEELVFDEYIMHIDNLPEPGREFKSESHIIEVN